MKKYKYYIIIILFPILLIGFIYAYYFFKNWFVEDNLEVEKTLVNVDFDDNILPNDDVQKNIENLDNQVDFKKEEEQKQEEDLELKKIEKEKIQKQKDILIFNNISKNWEIELCENIIDENLKEKCFDNWYASKASLEKSSDYCNKIKDINLQNKCLDNYYYNIALSNSKYDYCNNIQNINLQNKCNYIIILPIVEDPLYNLTNKICNLLTWEKKIYCLKVIEKKDDNKEVSSLPEFNDINNCENIENIELKTTCYDTIYLIKAQETNDISLCELIKSIDKKNNCLLNLSKSNDKELLNNAIKNNDIKLCDDIIDENIYQKCSDIINLKTAISNKNEDLCVELFDKWMKKQCIDFFKTLNSN